MTRTRRLLAGVAGLLALSVVATACDSSPFAASTNGQVIKQTALNAQLRQLAGNSYYVQLAAKGGYVGKSGITVTGATRGSYNAAWTAEVLTDMVIGAVVHQHLAKTGDLPGAAQYAATRAVDSVLYGPGAWGAFSPAFRTSLVARDADLAMVEPDTVTSSELQSVESSYATQLFSDVCVRTVTTAVNGPDGNVDFPASLAQAKAVVSAVEATPPTETGGVVTCYTAAQFETLSLSSALTVLELKVGTAAAPVKTADGYVVTAVTSRTEIPAGRALAQAFSVAVNQSEGMTAKVLAGLLAQAHVKVNPLYGTWSGSSTAPYGVVPPRAPAATS